MKKLACAILLACALPAQADRLPLPADTPASYRAECASCHLAYPPALLGASDWQQTLARLDRHFGSDATVDQPSALEIGRFLERHAGQGSRVDGAGDPPRITQTTRFVRKHRTVPPRFWRDPRVLSAANCEACHRHAADGFFSEHDLRIPELEH